MPPSDSSRKLGRYEVLRSLGRGAVGEVFLARDPALGRLVALKTLASLDALPPGERAEARARFLREARAAAGLSHPNIVTIHDVGEADGVPFIAMEHLEATTLDRYTQAGSLLPAVKTLELGIQAALALDEAHRRGIVHRDIKPANLALLADGSLKVVDFGLAKGPETDLTAAETLLGTPNYMSPEQIAGRTLDGRSDLFSLAVALFELLTGQRPFGGDTVTSVMFRIVNEAPLPLLRVRKDLPPKLDLLLARALAKNPENRPASCAEFAAGLREIVKEMGGVPPDLRLPRPAGPTAPRTAPPRAESAGGRRRRVVLALIAASALAIVALALFTPLGESLGLWTAAKTVLIETDPPGLAVRVTVDGPAHMEAPDRLVVPRAQQTPVVVEAGDDCRVATATLPPRSLPPRLRLRATPRPVKLKTTTTPTGASVVLDGADSGRSPVELTLAACEPHTVEFRAEGRDPVKITLDAGESEANWRARVENVLLPNAAPATEAIRTGQVVIAAPPGYSAEVRLAGDERRLGVAGKPLTLSAGAHQLELSNPDVLLHRVVSVKVVAGETVRVKVDWPRLGTLTVRAAPPGGPVLAKNDAAGAPMALGVTPLNRVAVVAGDYELIIEHPLTGKRISRTVSVRPDVDAAPVLVGQEDWR